MTIKNKTIIISFFSLALFLVLAGAVWAQACPDGFNYCSPPGACLPNQPTNPECTAANKGTDDCGNCTGCSDDYITCSGECVEPYEVENPVCQAQGKGTDQCGECTGCALGKILCSGSCVDPQIDTNDPSCDARRRGFNQCTGACTGCDSGWYDCEADPNFVCEQNGSLEGTACGGGFGVCQDACCSSCQIDQPWVPMAGDFGTPAPDDPSVIDSDAYTNPIIYINHLDPGSLDHDYMKFSTNGNSEFIVNNKGHIMIGLNAAGTVLAAGENAIYALVEGVAQGNFLLFEKKDYDKNPVFSISHEGKICWNGECRSSWGEIAGGAGAWTDVDGWVWPNDPGDYGDATPGEEGGLRITDTGDLLMDGDLTINGNIGIILEGNGNDAWLAVNALNNFYVDANGNVEIKLDNNNNGDNAFKIKAGDNRTIFQVDEKGFGAKFLGLTGNHNGKFDNGYEGANNFCKSAFPGSKEVHVCSSWEIVNRINLEDPDLPAAGFGWLSQGPPGYTAPANDCKGWTSNGSESGINSGIGAYWNFDVNGGSGWAAFCNTSMPFICCGY